MAEFSSMSPDERRRACAAWYLLAGHRALWNFPLFLAISVFIVLLLLRGTGEDPETNLRQSSAALATLQPQSIEDEMNAALDYQAAFPLIPAFKGKNEISPHMNLSKPGTYFENEEVLAYLESCEAAVQQLRSGAQKAKCNWKLNYSLGAAIPLPHLGTARNAARVLAARARAKAHQGDHKGAAAELDVIYRMARHVDSDTVLISSLVAVAMTSIADGMIESIVLYDAPTAAEDIAAYRNIFDRERSPIARIVRAMESEKVCMTYTIDLEMNKATAARAPMFAALGIPMLPGGAMPWYGADRKCFVNSIDEIIANARRGDFKSNSDFEKIMARHQQGPAIFTSVLLPVVSRLQDSFISTAERGVLIDAGLAFMQFRARHGRDAKSLQELVPEFLAALPTGVYHAQPLRMRVDARGIVYRPIYNSLTRKTEQIILHPGVIRIYSLGKNGLDEQGNNWDSGEKYEPVSKSPEVDDDNSFRIPPAQPLTKPENKDAPAP